MSEQENTEDSGDKEQLPALAWENFTTRSIPESLWRMVYVKRWKGKPVTSVSWFLSKPEAMAFLGRDTVYRAELVSLTCYRMVQ